MGGGGIAAVRHRGRAAKVSTAATATSPLPTLTTTSPTLSTNNFAHLQNGPVAGDAMQDFLDPPLYNI